MVQSPSWEANRFAASQEIPSISWNPRFINALKRVRKLRIVLSPEESSRQPPSWRTTPRQLSATAYSIYSQLPSLSEAVPLSATWGRAMPWWQGPTNTNLKLHRFEYKYDQWTPNWKLWGTKHSWPNINNICLDMKGGTKKNHSKPHRKYAVWCNLSAVGAVNPASSIEM